MDATLVLTRHDVVAIQVDLVALKTRYPHKVPKLKGMSQEDQVKKLHRQIFEGIPLSRYRFHKFYGVLKWKSALFVGLYAACL